MKYRIIAIIFCTSFMFSGVVAAESPSTSEDKLISGHMVAQAMLAAYFIDAAFKANVSKEQINAALKTIAVNSAISEFWISDENGKIDFTNFPEIDFTFPMDPSGTSQADPFAALIGGDSNVVVQDYMERELDRKLYKYVGVAGIDKSRIVQVGVSASQME